MNMPDPAAFSDSEYWDRLTAAAKEFGQRGRKAQQAVDQILAGPLTQQVTVSQASTGGLSRWVADADQRGVTTVITKHGKQMAVIVPMSVYERLRALEDRYKEI
jgi:prevent-host-death family protein